MSDELHEWIEPRDERIPWDVGGYLLPTHIHEPVNRFEAWRERTWPSWVLRLFPVRTRTIDLREDFIRMLAESRRERRSLLVSYVGGPRTGNPPESPDSSKAGAAPKDGPAPLRRSSVGDGRLVASATEPGGSFGEPYIKHSR